MCYQPLPSFARYTAGPVLLLVQTMAMTQWIPPRQAMLLGAPSFFMFPFAVYYIYYDAFIQTNWDLLGSLYGITVGGLLWNVTEMMYANAWAPRYFHFICLYAQWIYSFPMMLLVPLASKPSKMIINRYHMSLIIIFFLITSGLIWPYAKPYNWICHIYTFGLAIETSLTLTSKEFSRTNPGGHKWHDKFVGTVHTW